MIVLGVLLIPIRGKIKFNIDRTLGNQRPGGQEVLDSEDLD